MKSIIMDGIEELFQYNMIVAYNKYWVSGLTITTIPRWSKPSHTPLMQYEGDYVPYEESNSNTRSTLSNCRRKGCKCRSTSNKNNKT